MAFKKSVTSPPAYDSPYDLFKTLSGRKFPDLMAHQTEILASYQDNALNSKDVALQLPTGSGKTLVGLLIAEWRRRKYNEKVVYLCPTKQLVHQTHLQAINDHKIRTVPFTGSKRKYKPEDLTSYELARKVAITNYSSLFNINPAFEGPDIIIIDDSHAAENYIADMWSVNISSTDEKHKNLFKHVCLGLKNVIKNIDYLRLTGNWSGPSDIGVVEKLPTPTLNEIADDLVQILSQYIDETDQKYSWSLVSQKLRSCHLYYSSRGILIRPIIPPTWTLNAFSDAKQRVYMSATLGAGGDLERLTGRPSIKRLATPSSFQKQGVGRRFFIFPELQSTFEEADALRLKFIKSAGRSVVITPDNKSRDRIAKAVSDNTASPIFKAADIEKSKDSYLSQPNSCAIMANRYDGVDFPNEQSRLLCVDSLPKATNLQEAFFMTRLGARVLFNERVQTRVIQAIGRCTRSLQDYSAIFVTGRDLQQALVEPSNQKYLSPELQAEIKFGIDQSLNTSPKEMLENFKIFLNHGEEWEVANQDIVMNTGLLEQDNFPALENLQKSVKNEILYQKAIWQEDFLGALEKAKAVLTGLRDGSDLRGYRGLWSYLAGSAAFYHSVNFDAKFHSVAQAQYKEAMKASDGLSWLSRLSRLSILEDEVLEDFDSDCDRQLEMIERNLITLGNLHDANFSKKEAEILTGLNDKETFERAHRDLGEFLGFNAGKVETSGSPDPWWLSDNVCFVFEDHAGAKETSILSVTKARQVSSHPQWIQDNVEEVDRHEIIPILISPVSSVDKGGAPHLKTVAFWNLNDFIKWVQDCFSIIRLLRVEWSGEPDLLWKAKAKQLLQENKMTAKTLAVFLKSSNAYDKLEHVYVKPKTKIK